MNRGSLMDAEEALSFMRSHIESDVISDEDWKHLLTLLDMEHIETKNIDEVESYWRTVGAISEIAYSLLIPRQKRIELLLNLINTSEYVAARSLALWLLAADNASELASLFHVTNDPNTRNYHDLLTE
jgi:hypothetical protein